MRYTHKSKPVATVYEHVQLCCMCGKEGQRFTEQVYGTQVSRPKFHNQNIPVGWLSSYDGVYCSDECYKQSLIKKEQEND